MLFSHLWRARRASDALARPASAPHLFEETAARHLAELVQARRAVADAYENERHRIERDLHDGAQQHVVAALMEVGEARLSPALEADPQARRLLDEAHQTLREGLAALRATVRGISPDELVATGLEEALRRAVDRLDVPARSVVPHPLPVLPESLLASAYFVAVEALVNARKHAPGTPVTVLITAGAQLRISVVDGGPGGAVPTPGHELWGLAQRATALGGGLQVTSPAGGPTQVLCELPLLVHRGEMALPPAPDELPEGDPR